MDREISLRASDETRSRYAAVEIRPRVVITSERYKQWSASGEEGERQFADAFDQAVADVVEKYQIVEKDREHGLQDWLAVNIPYYFQHKHYVQRLLTSTQDRECRQKIAKAGHVLLEELPRLFNLEPLDIDRKLLNGDFDQIEELRQAAGDWLELKQILLRAQSWEPIDGHTTRERNSAKPALIALGDDIRCFWVTGWSKWLEEPRPPTLRPVIAAASGYVQFAKYIYAFVQENCEEEGVIARLKAVEDEHRALLPNENCEYQNLWKLLESYYGQAGHKKQEKKNNA